MLPIPPKMLVSVSESTPVCTDQKPCNSVAMKQYPVTFQLAQLALTDVAYLRSISLCCSKTVHRKLQLVATKKFLLLGNKEERRDPTELAKCLHSAMFDTGKSKDMCEVLFFFNALVSRVRRVTLEM